MRVSFTIVSTWIVTLIVVIAATFTMTATTALIEVNTSTEALAAEAQAPTSVSETLDETAQTAEATTTAEETVGQREARVYYAEAQMSEKAYQACLKYGSEYNICPELLMAMIEVESSGNPNAVNGDCKGLMQVSEKWHKDRMAKLGVTDLYSTDGNIHVATDYLAELFDRYEDVGLVLDTYNGNSNAVYNYEHGIISTYANKILTRSYELEMSYRRWSKCI